MGQRVNDFSQVSIASALRHAGLGQEAMKRGPHPDSGEDCLYLEATIQQYSVFLTALAVHYRTTSAMAGIANEVQLQYDSRGDTRFWIPGLHIAHISRAS